MNVQAAAEVESFDVEDFVAQVRALIKHTPPHDVGGFRFTFLYGPWGIECHRRKLTEKPTLLGHGTTRFRVVIKDDGADMTLWNVRDDEEIADLHQRKPAAFLHEILEVLAPDRAHAAAEAPACVGAKDLFVGFVKKLRNNPNVTVDDVGVPDHQHLHEVFFNKLGVTVKFYSDQKHPFIYVTNTKQQYRRLEGDVTVDKLLRAVRELAVAHVTGAAEAQINHYSQRYRSITPGRQGKLRFHGFEADFIVFRAEGTNGLIILRDDTVEGVFEDVWHVLQPKGQALVLTKVERDHDTNKQTKTEVGLVRNDAKFLQRAFKIIAVGEHRAEAAAEAPAKKNLEFLENLSIDPARLKPVPGQRGVFDYDGDVRWNGKKLKKLPIRFRHVSGAFYCHDNSLTSLNGAPETVGGRFSCARNALTSLEGSPTTVFEHFYCNENYLTSLRGAPEKVGGHFHCEGNLLTSLEGAPESVCGNFFCEENRLPSSTRKPAGVKGRFYGGDQRQAAHAAAEVPAETEVDKHVRQIYEMVMRDGVEAGMMRKKLLRTTEGPLTLKVFNGSPRQLELRFQGVQAYCRSMHNTLDVDILYQGVTTNVVIPKQKSSKEMLAQVIKKMGQERGPATAAAEVPTNKLQELLDKLVLKLSGKTKTIDLKRGPYSYAIARYSGQYFEIKLSDVLGPIGTEADTFYVGTNTGNYGDNCVFFDSVRRRRDRSLRGYVQVPASVTTHEQLLAFFIRYCVDFTAEHPLEGRS